jgi:hypothetical protein
MTRRSAEERREEINAHQVLLAIGVLICHYGAMYIRDHRVGVRNGRVGVYNCNVCV